MDAKQLFFARYHGFREYPEHLLKGLTEQQIRQAAHAALNPIAWTLWHITRCEDVGANRLLADRAQVLDDGAWTTRLQVAQRGVGTGMSKNQVTRLSAAIDLSELNAYRAAVMDRTQDVVGALPLDELNHELKPKRLRQVFVVEEAGGPAAESIVEAYRGRTKGWLLGHLLLTHHYYHIGQAFGVRAVHGAVNPW